MASKLLVDPDRIGKAEPLVWRNAEGSRPAAREPGNAKGFRPAPASDTDQTAQMVISQQHRIQQLEAELEHRARQAHQQGFTEGQTIGAQQASQRLEPVMARMARAIDELEPVRRRARAEAEEDAVRLAIAVARKILHREFAIDPDALLGLVKAAMQRIDAREINRVRLHPEDIPGIERHLQVIGMPARLEVVADPSLERGSAVFETTRGNLDASIATQLQEIEKGFVDLVRRSRNAV